MLFIFFCLFSSFFACGSQSSDKSDDDIVAPIVISVHFRPTIIIIRRHNPYRVYKLYSNGRPRLSHSEESVRVIYK